MENIDYLLIGIKSIILYQTHCYGKRARSDACYNDAIINKDGCRI